MMIIMPILGNSKHSTNTYVNNDDDTDYYVDNNSISNDINHT